jgi:Ca2+-transporting ATPase
VALGLDTSTENVMHNRPNRAENGLFAGGLWARIICEGAMIGVLALVAFSLGHFYFDVGESVEVGRTMAFATLAISQLVHAFNMRSNHSIVKGGLLGNTYLLGAFAIGVALQVAVVMFEPLSRVFRTQMLTGMQWLVVAGLSILPIVLVEIEKLVIPRAGE